MATRVQSSQWWGIVNHVLQLSDVLTHSCAPSVHAHRPRPALLTSTGTRSLLYCSYFSVAVAVVLTVLVRLRYDVGHVDLASPLCTSPTPDCGPEPRGLLRRIVSVVLVDDPQPSCACVAPGANGGNWTVWTGEVVNLNPLSGDVTLTLVVTAKSADGSLAAPSPPLVMFSTLVEGSVNGWDHWERLYTSTNQTFSLAVPAMGQSQYSLVGSFADASEQDGNTGFDKYRMTVNYNANLTQFADVSYIFE